MTINASIFVELEIQEGEGPGMTTPTLAEQIAYHEREAERMDNAAARSSIHFRGQYLAYAIIERQSAARLRAQQEKSK